MPTRTSRPGAALTLRSIEFACEHASCADAQNSKAAASPYRVIAVIAQACCRCIKGNSHALLRQGSEGDLLCVARKRLSCAARWASQDGGEEGIRTLDTALDRITV